MTKYRMLKHHELKELEPEFIQFLVEKGMTGTDWVTMKKERPEEAGRILDQFSDMVFDRIMGSIEYLEYRDSNTVSSLHCKEDKIEIVAMTSSADNTVDFTDPDFIAHAIENPPKDLKVVRTEQAYGKERGKDIFKMIEKGFRVTDSSLHEVLLRSVRKESK